MQHATMLLLCSIAFLMTSNAAAADCDGEGSSATGQPASVCSLLQQAKSTASNSLASESEIAQVQVQAGGLTSSSFTAVNSEVESINDKERSSITAKEGKHHLHEFFKAGVLTGVF
mmetsp:Transcript_142709/g.248866  ORF Transcript_142709/g.248866 Transcript_142709/m.248866 type:complete len:116 (-) Transcript_142709:53-400(-)